MIVRAYVGRGARLWLLTRLAVGIVFLFGQANPLDVSTRNSFGLVLVSTFACAVDTTRRRELVLLGNLGVSHAQLAAFFALPAIAGESLLRILMAALGA
jgi:hypothetical protein